MMTDSSTRLAIWQRLMLDENRPLRALAGQIDERNVAELSQLREKWPADLVAAAVELARARRKADLKYTNAHVLIADVAGVEQATSELVAQHKAKRFASLRPKRIYDLCCGIGGDAMALAEHAPVIAVDHDPVRAWMASQNACCETICADVTTFNLRGEVFHLDPSRRDESGGGRKWRYEDYEPGPPFIDALLMDNPDGAIKLGPGVHFASLPLNERCELEVINERGTLVQAVLWSGRLARHPGERTATRLPEDISYTGTPGQFMPHSDGTVSQYLFVPDPALERAELVASFAQQTDLREINPGLGLLTSSSIFHTQWLDAYTVHATLPWREKKVREWLAAHDAGIVTIKTRGKAVNPDQVARDLRGLGEIPFTIFVVRFGQPVVAVITTPVTAPTES